MRAINITGKHNIDQIKKIGNDKYKAERKHMTDLDETMATHKYQFDVIRYMFVNNDVYVNNDVCVNNKYDTSLFYKELTHKIQGYKGQDIKKDIHNKESLINIEHVLEKLVASKMSCCYCSKPILVLYKNVREPMQWTLDRIDNDMSHTNENTCISCLKCNLQRRVMDVDKFTFTKKLKINKL
jgi:hypothetical protein